MIFTSLQFVEFFAVVYLLYRVLPHRGQNWMLLGASYVFYGFWDWRFLSLLWGSTIVDFLVARYLGRETDQGKRRAALVLSLVFNFGMLGFFKYFNFFEDSLVVMAGWVGWHLDPLTLNVLLPIGISFYTFMTVSYVIDVYRREIVPTTHLADFALFVAYFPHLVAGPILRASLLLPQIEKPRTITREQIVGGLWLIGWGASRRCSWPTIWRRSSTPCSGRRRPRRAPTSWWRAGRSRFRSTATSPAIRTSRAACRS
jgi:D-alanyl-lipoteichoic acid acyltransferase DltB (MBOAT superfamily)